MAPPYDLVCLSHLRWDFVTQRPQHLMGRAAAERRVFFVEEPVYEEDEPRLNVSRRDGGLHVLTPVIPDRLIEQNAPLQRQLLEAYMKQEGITNFVLWYYTPMPRSWTRHWTPLATVYDCMDELSAFHKAPPVLLEREAELLERANVVFTGGQSLYEAKNDKNPNVHAFPSSIEPAHFKHARQSLSEPEDQAAIPHPRIGFYGVVDERLDLELLASIANLRPDYQYVILGPVAKIAPEDLPCRANIHYLGQKSYQELPAYLSGWDAAMMPFALNEATRYISPTKTPEYLAAGKPVVSTSIRDVARPYGESALVHMADTPEEFVTALDTAIREEPTARLKQVDTLLAQTSWDKTWGRMADLMEVAIRLNARGNGAAAFNERDEEEEEAAFRAAPASWSPVSGNAAFDYVIVGAGFAGSVLAERLASQAGKKVLVLDKRSHIAGNAYDEYDAAGILIHRYGPHIFHTNSARVFDYLSQFTQWRPYEHRVLASVEGQLLPIPINRDTVNRLYNLNLQTEEDVEAFYGQSAEPVAHCRTSEDVVVSRVGRDLYEKFFRGYTRKQWGLDPSQLDAQVTARVPARSNTDDRYFTDSFQAMPLRGYTRMFEAMLDHPNIKVMLNTDYREIEGFIPYKEMIFTGPVDQFFDYCYGKLPYRSLEFRHETLDEEQHLPVAVVNYPNENEYTRITEFKHLTGQQHAKTSVVYEYPRAEGDPYYPIPKAECTALYNKYKTLADATQGVTFVGRLATYKYYNMDQVVAQALATYDKIAGVKEERAERAPLARAGEER